MCYNNNVTIKHLPVAQLDSASDSDSEGRRFESFRVGQAKKPPDGGFFAWPTHRGATLRARNAREGSHSPPEDRGAALQSKAIHQAQGVGIFVVDEYPFGHFAPIRGLFCLAYPPRSDLACKCAYMITHSFIFTFSLKCAILYSERWRYL